MPASRKSLGVEGHWDRVDKDEPEESQNGDGELNCYRFENTEHKTWRNSCLARERKSKLAGIELTRSLAILEVAGELSCESCSCQVLYTTTTAHHPVLQCCSRAFIYNNRLQVQLSLTGLSSPLCLLWQDHSRLLVAATETLQVRNCPDNWHHNTGLSFWSLSFCLDIILIKCLKGLESQKSLFMTKC